MKEYLSHIEPEEFDRKIYPQLVMGYMVGQKDMFTDDILFTANPEKFPPQKEEPPCEEPPAKHPLQGEFILSRPIKFDGLKVK